MRTMNWRNDLRVKKLLDKAVLENIFKIYIQRIYGKEEINEMERALQNALDKYSKKNLIYEFAVNNDNDAVPLLNECLDSLCEKAFNRCKSHTPQTLLTLAKLFMKVGDYRLACEVIWGSASLAIQDFIDARGLNVKLYSHNSKSRFAYALSLEIGLRFSQFETCHTSFYNNRKGARDVNVAFNVANEFLQILNGFELTAAKKQDLERDNFNY